VEAVSRELAAETGATSDVIRRIAQEMHEAYDTEFVLVSELRGEIAVDLAGVPITVSERGGRWFVGAQAEMAIEVPQHQGPACGLDLGVSRLGVSSDGTVFVNPKADKRVAKAMRRARRIARRRRLSSANRRRVVQHIKRLDFRAANIRADAIHKMTTALTRNKSAIVIEDLRPNQMLRHPTLGTALRDAAFGEIRRQLAYKAVWRGSVVIVAPRWYPSSKICSACGALSAEHLSLGQRRFSCPSCGAEIDRDLNAARNLLTVAGSSADTQNACGEGVSTLDERQPSSNQEPAIRPVDGETENGGTTAVVVDLVDFALISDDREE
jgi:putative transposase